MAETKIFELSNIYNSIQITELARHLSMEVEEAEQILLKLVMNKKLKATIDQVEGIVYFEGHHEIDEWENKIVNLPNLISGVAEDITDKHPDL